MYREHYGVCINGNTKQVNQVIINLLELNVPPLPIQGSKSKLSVLWIESVRVFKEAETERETENITVQTK